ncbi:hypothetical protein NYE40_23945 [Paenibacillus sp. FSL W8-1187]|uniref:hypothetical protein n=1 Tax=Paenibacillus sp. FSL W8-1187 TaxID=2975339 RepID=UPI0030DC63DA
MSEAKQEFPWACGDSDLVLVGIEVKIPASALPCKAVLEAIRECTASYEESAREHDYDGIRILSLNVTARDPWEDEISVISNLLNRHAEIVAKLQEAAGEVVPENVRIALVVSHGDQRFTFAPFHER